MRPFFLVEPIRVTTTAMTATPTRPHIDEYNIPDEHFITLHSLDTYLRDRRIVNTTTHVVYVCAGKLLTEHTDIDALTHPIVGYIVQVHRTPRPLLPINTDLSNNNLLLPQVNSRVLESATSLVSRINELITQVSSFRNSIDASSPFSSPFSNPNLLIHNPSNGDSEEPDEDDYVDSEDQEDDGHGDSGESDPDDDHEDLDNDIVISVRNSPNIPPQVPPLNIQHVIQQIRNAVLPPPYPYQTQLNQMRELGFTDMRNMMSALEIAQGEVDEAISIYFTLSET